MSSAHDRYPEFMHSRVDSLETTNGSNTNVNRLEVSLHVGDVPAEDVHVVQEQVNTVVTLDTALVRDESPARQTLVTLWSGDTRQTLTPPCI